MEIHVQSHDTGPDLTECKFPPSLKNSRQLTASVRILVFFKGTGPSKSSTLQWMPPQPEECEQLKLGLIGFKFQKGKVVVRAVGG